MRDYKSLNERTVRIVNKYAEDKEDFSNIAFIRLGNWFHGRLEGGMRKISNPTLVKVRCQDS